jgi:hypothetical protein
VGIVEQGGTPGKQAFTCLDELWGILNPEPIRKATKGQRQESLFRQEKKPPNSKPSRREGGPMNPKETNKLVILCTLLVLALWGTIAQAESIDMLSCGSSTVNVLAAGEGLSALILEGKGINLDSYGNKAFDNMTFHCGGLLKIDRGKWSGPMLCKYMDPSGDFYVVELEQSGMERDWKLTYGSGKWKGITGTGKAVQTTKGKEITPGTFQGCYRITGTYELKK